MVDDRLVPYEHRETRSQQARVSRAEEGDLQARLQLIPLELVEQALANGFRKNAPDSSILSYLQSPDDGIPRHQAVINVFEELADRSEQTATLTTLLFRYVQVTEAWKGHAGFRSAEDLVRSLTVSDVVEANIVMGASTHTRKQRQIRTIEKIWGAAWFVPVLEAFPDSQWATPEVCPLLILMEIARNARRGVSRDRAIDCWRTSMERRTDAGLRRKFNIRGSAAARLMQADVASSLVTTEDIGDESPTGVGGGAGEGERLRVEVRPRASTTDPEPGRAADGPEKSHKRKRSEKSKGQGGRKKPKAAGRPPTAAANPESSPPPRPEIHHAELHACQGPLFAQFILRFIRRCRDYKFLHATPAQLAQQCCDSCSDRSFQTLTLLEWELRRAAEALQRVERHVYRGAVIPAGPLAEDTPPTSPDTQSPIFIGSSPDIDSD